MAQRPKRKLDSYEQSDIISSAAMPQTNTTRPSGNTTDYYDDRYTPIVPTLELQELYNTWRQQQELDAHLKEQAQVGLGSSDGGSQHLRPHSAVSMSRSPSCASTSHSVTGGMKNMGLSDDKPAKKKQGRQGALNALKKAKAALVRKLSACSSCRSRKVGCLHHNFRHLEDAYQLSKQIVPPVAQRVKYNTSENTRTQQQDLIGVGVGPNLSLYTPYQSTYNEAGGQQDAHADLDDLLLNVQASPMSPNSTSPLYFLSGPSRSQNTVSPTYNNYTNPYTNYNHSFNYNSIPTTAVDTSYAYLSPFTPLVSSDAPVTASGTQTTATDPITNPAEDRHIAIGRRIASIGQQIHGYQGGGFPSSQYGGSITQGDGQWEWECLYGDDGSASSVSYPRSNYSGSNEAPQACKQRYGKLEHLETHFQKDHLPFENGRIYPYCTLHEQHYDYEMMGGQCPSCSQGTGYYEGGGANTAAGPDGGWFSFPPLPTATGTSTSTSDQFQEQWYFGNIIPQRDHGTGQKRSERVPSKDGGLSGGPFGSLMRSSTVTQLDMWNNTSYGAGGGWGGSCSAANQGGGRRRGNSTFPRGDSFSSLLSPRDLSLGPSAGEGGSNHAHRYGDAGVNLMLSPPPSSFLKTMPFASLSSKMMLSPLIFPPSSKTSDAIHTKHDNTSCLPNTAAPSTTKTSGQAHVATTRGRARARSYCPYYAYGKELMGARQSKSMKRSASDIRGRSSVSISASLGWPSAGTCARVLDHPSSSYLASPKLLILLSVVVMLILTMTDALPVPALSPSSSTAAKIAEKSSVMCVVLGLVGMWIVRKNHWWFRPAKDGLRSHGPSSRGEPQGPPLSGVSVTGDYPQLSANMQGIYSHAHAHAHAHVHPQASAAAAG